MNDGHTALFHKNVILTKERAIYHSRFGNFDFVGSSHWDIQAALLWARILFLTGNILYCLRNMVFFRYDGIPDM